MKTPIRWLSLLCGLLLSLPLMAGEDIWIDVRTDQEWDAGHLQGAEHIPFEQIGDKIAAITDDKDAAIKLYCRSGRRAGIAQKALEELGYTNVENVRTLEAAREQAGQ